MLKIVVGFVYSILYVFNLVLINERIIDFWDYYVLFGKSRLEMVLKLFKFSVCVVLILCSMGCVFKKVE